MKVAPVLRALSARSHATVFVHTGQHYDEAMSDAFARDLELPTPDFHLGVGSGSHATQTARVMQAFEPIILETRPDWLVVVGDVNSTLACALVAAKLRPEIGCRIAHVEAGLRSGDWRMPEEVNRVLTDRLSDLLLTPSPDALDNLRREGLDPASVTFVGNVMIDSLLRLLPAARAASVPERFGLAGGPYALATLHRPSNVDDATSLRLIIEALVGVTREMPVALPLHPRTRARLRTFGLESMAAALRVLDPLPYVEMLGLLDGAEAVLTDSGGVQEESTVLGVPCVTLREQTERPITVSEGTNRLAPWPLSTSGIAAAFAEARAAGRRAVGERAPKGWDGCAAQRIVTALEDFPSS
jgi:UDP-N-acetylglucosamine 2-epimerase (non-hydrolysing)